MSCHKRIFQTRSEAMKAKKFLNKKFDVMNSVYKCPECAWYHLTTQDREPNPHFRASKGATKINEQRS